MSRENFSRFENLTFDDFRALAKDASLTQNEKVGFPESYREGKEDFIFSDISAKLKNISLPERNIMEIGPGCSELPIKLAQLCKDNNSKLIFIDSEEMLSQLPKGPHITEYYGAFPSALGDDLDRLSGTLDAVVVYSVLQYVFAESELWEFVDLCMRLLTSGGEILFGDLPNESMRDRFISSPAAAAFRNDFSQGCESSAVMNDRRVRGHMDDRLMISILSRAREQGFHAWILPQNPSLPMANRREDIVIRKP